MTHKLLKPPFTEPPFVNSRIVLEACDRDGLIVRDMCPAHTSTKE